ncbi:TraR/DksA family transcriptional regulator [Salmonella enterica subsp. enterica serovar Infantis]|nr:TraR/DksA family transcriptional regulator [Salmonella enterica subsp. enterica serovar Infantis]
MKTQPATGETYPKSDLFNKAAARVKHCGASALVCEECDAPIPAARRAAYPSATRCVSCQSVFEAKNKHYRRTA